VGGEIGELSYLGDEKRASREARPMQRSQNFYAALPAAMRKVSDASTSNDRTVGAAWIRGERGKARGARLSLNSVFSALSGCGFSLSSGQLGFGLQPVVQIMSFLPAALLIKAVRASADLFFEFGRAASDVDWRRVGG
jgi:hypothetical protein